MMLLAILGAGASYDSVDPKKHGDLDDRDRPPLTDQLFDPRFRAALRHFPLAGVVGRLRDLPPGTTLEETLEVIQDEAKDYPKRYEQLTAVKFYLQHVLTSCGNAWADAADQATNYAALLDRVDEWRHRTDEHVAIVTFNYDLMVEHALKALYGIVFDEVDDWIRGPHYRLYKLHGSVNWTHPVSLPNHPDPPNVREMIDRAGTDLRVVDDVFGRIDNPGDLNSTGDVYPAIAIPVVRKNIFDCPAGHIETLRTSLPEADRILAIGWRGTERHFLELWKTLVDPNRVRQTLIVAGGADAARETTANITAAGVMLRTVNHFDNGFSELVRGSALTDFLST